MFIVSVPILANVISHVQSSQPSLAILGFLDAEHLSVPKNLVRLYLASVIVGLVQGVASMVSGAQIARQQTFDDWKATAEGEIALEGARKAERTGAVNVEKKLYHLYLGEVSTLENALPWVRWTLAFLMGLSIYLSCLVIFDNVLSVTGAIPLQETLIPEVLKGQNNE